MDSSLKFNFYTFNQLYNDKKLKVLSFIINNSVNDPIQGQLILQGPPINLENCKIDIEWSKYKFCFYVDKYWEYYDVYGAQEIIYDVYIYDGIYKMNHNQYNRCWNNYSNTNIMDILLNNYGIKNINNLNKINFSTLIQFQQTDMDFFQGVLYRSQGIFYYNNGLILDNQLKKQSSIDKNFIINGVKKKGPTYKIIKNSYDYTNINHSKNIKTHNINLMDGVYEKNFYNRETYPETHYHKYFINHWDTQLGDYDGENVIIANYFIFFIPTPLKFFNEKINGLLEDINLEYRKNHFFNIAFMAPSNSIKIHYKQKNPGLFHGFVKAIDNKYSNQYGDILVEFPWDNKPIGKEALTNICWVRCSQSLAGTQYGSWMIPAIGQEVIVGFFDNNLDMPLVLGTLYNEFQKPQDNNKNHNPKEIILQTKENKITIDEQEKNIAIKTNNSINTTVQGNYDINLKSNTQEKERYNIVVEDGNINIQLNQGNINIKIKGDVNFNIQGNCNFNVENDFNLKCKNFNINNNKTQWIQDNYSLETKDYYLKTIKSQETVDNYQGKFTMYSGDYQQLNMKSLQSTFNLKLMNISSDLAQWNIKIFSLASNLLNMKGSLVTIKSDTILNIQVGVLMNIITVLFNLSSTMTVIIRGGIPGTIGSFPPFYP